MTELALERWRSGYRRIWLLLRREVFHVNHKRVYAVTNGAIVIHTQRLKSDPGGNLLS